MKLCPCESGLDYAKCCGVDGRTAVNAELQAKLTLDGVEGEENITPQVQSAIDNITTNPDLFAARFNFPERKAWFVKMSAQTYQDSVFLDPARLKGSYVIEYGLPRLRQDCADLDFKPSGFIFHTAFCGSTLMAQALDALYHCLPLREPEALTNLVYLSSSAQVTPDFKKAWMNIVLGLLSRTYDEQQLAVIKANDIANPMMQEILQWIKDAPVLFMYTPLEEFLAGCLKADNRREWIRSRYHNVNEQAIDLLPMPADLSVNEDDFGKMAAVYWCYNMALYLNAYEHSTGQLHSLPFRQLMQTPREAIQACADRFSLTPRENIDIDQVIENLFGVYSKNPSVAYSPQQREQDIKRILDNNAQQLEQANSLAQQLLQDSKLSDDLPGSLV